MGDIGGKHIAIHRSIEDHRGGYSRSGQSRHQSGGLPMTMEDSDPAPISSPGPATTAGHFGIGAAFIIAGVQLPVFAVRRQGS